MVKKGIFFLGTKKAKKDKKNTKTTVEARVKTQAPIHRLEATNPCLGEENPSKTNQSIS